MNTSKHNKSPHDPIAMTNIISNHQFGVVIDKAKRLLKIQQLLAHVLDNESLTHCHVLNIENNQLVVATDNAAWATRIRYEEAEIVQYLQQFPETRMIQFIQCHVRPATAAPKLIDDKPPMKRHLSDSSRSLIRDAADNIADEKLKAALIHLSQVQGC